MKNHKEVYDEILNYTKHLVDIEFKFRIWHWANNEPNYILCECGNRVSGTTNWEKGYKKFCSSKCVANSQHTIESKKKTYIEKYGVEHYSKTAEYVTKVKKTTLQRYGVDNYSKTDEYVEKSKKTYFDKYGVDHYTKTHEYVEKSKRTCQEKYGVDHYSKTDEYKNKFKETCNLKYGIDHIFKSNEYRLHNFQIAQNEFYISYSDGKNYFRCDCDEDHVFTISTDDYFGRKKSNNKLCTICNPISDSASIKQKMLLDYISNMYIGKIVEGYKDKFEIDIFLPDLKIGFEFNGIYWHSDKYRNKNYHVDKTSYFKKRGIRIIHIWEDDWTLRNDIITSKIRNTLNLIENKIFARKCLIKEVPLNECVEFLEKNHIQGKSASNIKLGLYHGGELVSVMTFDKFEGRKKLKVGEWNINRFCSKLNMTVCGGASKLINYFINKYAPSRIISYADRDWSEGNLYTQLGFNKLYETQPDYKYVIGHERVHKSRFRKSKLKTNISERQEMLNKNILRVYDCGKIKFERII